MTVISVFIIGVVSLIASVVGVIIMYIRARDIAPLIEKREHLEADIASAQNTLSDLQEKNLQLLDQEVHAQSIIAESKKEREWLDENRDLIAQLREAKATIQQQIKECTDAYNDVNEKFKEADTKLQEARSEHQELSLSKERLSIEISNLKSDIKAAESKKSDLENELLKIEEIISSLKKKQNDLNSSIAELTSELNILEQRKSAEKALLEQLQNDIKELQTKKKDFENQISSIAEKISDMQVQKKELDNRIKLSSVDVNTGKHRWEDLEREVVSIPQTPVYNEEKENEWLERFGDTLNQNGIKFNQRTLCAFHTGLKVADASPIVVLAGISGTGKSLLPRLYAHACGMNYLQAAVQPRWDSPQDMLGFYNYMEHRFKATELSRFLWQFDTYNNQKAAQRFHDKEPMNMILLDEMNLARVEYYFSDMLSKLEVRRGLSSENEKQRRAAEIEIECGASDKDTETRRLFVGSNMLFVGTMNEDETTQTLSDKVMDRSNVLRFGRPQELESHPNIEGFLNSYEDRLLTKTHWNSWQNNNSSNEDRLRETMEALNDCMANLGRPFAHRVWQAVESYVLNYPVLDGSLADCAIADQIEMKILPKLQGLEKEDSRVKEQLDKIGDIIESLADDDLINAYRMANEDASNPFFQWHGIVR